MLIRPILAGLLCFGCSTAAGAETPLVASIPATQAVRYELKYRFERNELLRFQLEEKSNILTVSGGNRHLAVNDSALYKHYRVLETYKDGSARLELVMDRARMKFTMGHPDSIDKQTPVEYDTASDAAPPKQLASLKTAMGRPVAIAKVAADGRLLDMKDLVSNGAQQNQDRHNFLVVLPKEPIPVGGTWTHSYDVPLRLTERITKNFRLTQQFKLTSVRGGVAEISFATIVAPRLVDPVLRAQFIQKLPRGTIRFDLERGMMLSQTQQIDETELNVGEQGNLLQVVSTRRERLVDAEAKLSPAAN